VYGNAPFEYVCNHHRHVYILKFTHRRHHIKAAKGRTRLTVAMWARAARTVDTLPTTMTRNSSNMLELFFSFRVGKSSGLELTTRRANHSKPTCWHEPTLLRWDGSALWQPLCDGVGACTWVNTRAYDGYIHTRKVRFRTHTWLS